MNEHAEKIYRASLDGREVQFNFVSDRWQNANPFHHASSPLICPELWRIKPEKRSELRHLRVYLDEEANSAAIYHLSSGRETKRLENMDYFGGWITSWIPYRVEVEE